MEPHRTAAPLGRESGLPDGSDPLDVDPTVELRQAATGLRVVVGRRGSSVPAVLTGERAAGWIAALEGEDEFGDRDREAGHVFDSSPMRRLARQPPTDGPRERKALARFALAQYRRHGEREQRCQPGQPLVLLGDRRNVSGAGGQTGRHLIAEAVGPVVPAVDFDRGHRQVLPLRELRGNEALHQGAVDSCTAIGMRRSCHVGILAAGGRAGKELSGNGQRAGRSSSAVSGGRGWQHGQEPPGDIRVRPGH